MVAKRCKINGAWLSCCCALLSIGILHSQEKSAYQVVGKVLQSDRQPFAGVAPLVFLDSATSPFSVRASADRGGEFKFRNIPAGTYTLIAYVPRAGEARKTIEVGPSFADTKKRITVEILVGRDLAGDEEHLVSAAQLSIPPEAKNHFLRAMTQLERRETEAAIASLQKAVEIAPQFVGAWNYLGTIAYTTRRYADAESYFRKALEKDPDSYSPLVNLGGALLALDRTEESLEVNRKAVRAKPDDPLAQSQLGMSCYYLGRYEEAESHLKQAKSLDAGHFTLPQILLASIYERRRDPEAAIRELEDFLKRHPDSDRAPAVRIKIDALRLESIKKEPPPG